MKNFKLKKGISTVYPITNEKDFNYIYRSENSIGNSPLQNSTRT